MGRIESKGRHLVTLIDDIDRCAEALYEARLSGNPIPPLTSQFPDWAVPEGYAVQQRLVERLVAEGDRIVGYKLGLTSAPMQELLKVDQPDFSPIFASGVFNDGASLCVADFIAPRVEAEIALVLADDLSGPDCTPAKVAAATEGLVAAIEIVDSRIADWKITIADTIADLASGGSDRIGIPGGAIGRYGSAFDRHGVLSGRSDGGDRCRCRCIG